MDEVLLATTKAVLISGAALISLVVAAEAKELACNLARFQTEPDLDNKNLAVDTIIAFNLTNIRLLVPYGYFFDRYSVDVSTCRNDRGSLDFNFWIPDLSAPEEDSFGATGWRPVEKNRTHAPNEFLVIVTNTKREELPGSYNLFLPPISKPLDPDLQDTGLTSMLPAGDMDIQTAALFERTEKSEAVVYCYATAPGREFCEFKLNLKSIGFSMKGYIPRSGLPRWKEIKDGITKLLVRWSDVSSKTR